MRWRYPHPDPDDRELLRELRAFYADFITWRRALMATIADLTAASTALTDAEHALEGEVLQVATDVTALRAAFDAAVASGGLSPADQAALDTAVQAVTDSTTALATATGSLEATDAETNTTPPATP